MVIDNTLFDIKCTKNNTAYEIKQLLGYAGLISCNPKFKTHITSMSIINLLQGELTTYDITCLTNEHLLNYLKLL